MRLFSTKILLLVFLASGVQGAWLPDYTNQKHYGGHRFYFNSGAADSGWGWWSNAESLGLQPFSNYFRTDKADTGARGFFTSGVNHADTADVMSAGGSAPRAWCADSLGSIASLMRAYPLSSGWFVVDSAGTRVDSVARVGWVRGLNIPNAKNADSLNHKGPMAWVDTSSAQNIKGVKTFATRDSGKVAVRGLFQGDTVYINNATFRPNGFRLSQNASGHLDIQYISGGAVYSSPLSLTYGGNASTPGNFTATGQLGIGSNVEVSGKKLRINGLINSAAISLHDSTDDKTWYFGTFNAYNSGNFAIDQAGVGTALGIDHTTGRVYFPFRDSGKVAVRDTVIVKQNLTAPTATFATRDSGKVRVVVDTLIAPYWYDAVSKMSIVPLPSGWIGVDSARARVDSLARVGWARTNLASQTDSTKDAKRAEVTDTLRTAGTTGKVYTAGDSVVSSRMTVTGGAAGTKTLIVRANSSDNSNSFETQNSSGTSTTTRADAGGNFGARKLHGGGVLSDFEANVSFTVKPLGAAFRGGIVRGNASQTANLMEYQLSGGTVMGGINSQGSVFSDSAFFKWDSISTRLAAVHLVSWSASLDTIKNLWTLRDSNNVTVQDTSITRKKSLWVSAALSPADTASLTNSRLKVDTIGGPRARITYPDTNDFTGGMLLLPYSAGLCPELTENGQVMVCAAGLYFHNASGSHTFFRTDTSQLIDGTVHGTKLQGAATTDTLLQGYYSTNPNYKLFFSLANGYTHSESLHAGFIYADTTNKSGGGKGTGVIAGDTILGNARQNKYTFYGVCVQGDTFDSWQWPGTDTIVVYRIDIWQITAPTGESWVDKDTLKLMGSDSIKIAQTLNTRRIVWTGRTLFKAGVNTSWVCKRVQETGAADVNITVWYYPHAKGPGGTPWKGLASVIHPALGYALAILALGGAALAKFKKKGKKDAKDSGPTYG